MAVPAMTTPSHAIMRQSNPAREQIGVSGPGAMKNTNIHNGQWLNR